MLYWRLFYRAVEIGGDVREVDLLWCSFSVPREKRCRLDMLVFSFSPHFCGGLGLSSGFTGLHKESLCVKLETCVIINIRTWVCVCVHKIFSIHRIFFGVFLALVAVVLVFFLVARVQRLRSSAGAFCCTIGYIVLLVHFVYHRNQHDNCVLFVSLFSPKYE